MKNFILFIVIAAFAANVMAAPKPTRTLMLRWQKPDVELKQECGVTEAELQQALRTLTQDLKKTGTGVQLGYLRAGTVPEAPVSGLWINGKPLETWLNGEIAVSETGCVTLKLADKSYDRIPASVIVKAGMLAAERPISERKAAVAATQH